MAPWRRRAVHDMVFAIDGAGWHEPEMRDGVGYRWSGPGRLSVLRVPALPGGGRAEAAILVMPGEAIPDVAVLLNGHPLAVTRRRLAAFGVLDIAWDAAVTDGEALHEFWFLAERTFQVPTAGERMRSVGFRLSALTVEPLAEAPAPGREALALVAGRRFLAERLPVVAGRAQVSLRTAPEGSLLDMRLEGVRLGPAAMPQLALSLQAGPGATRLAVGVPDNGILGARLPAGGPLAFDTALPIREEMLLLRLIAALPGAFGRGLEPAMGVAARDAAACAEWRRRLAALARAAEARLVALFADGPDPFAGDPAAPFVWPAISR